MAGGRNARMSDMGATLLSEVSVDDGSAKQKQQKTSDRVIVCIERKDRDWKYQRMSIAGRLVCKF